MAKASGPRPRLLCVLLLACLIIIIVFPLNIKSAHAESITVIHIREDGSVYPPVAQIKTSDIYGDRYYCLEYSLLFTEEPKFNHYTIVIERDNIVLDGKNFRLEGLSMDDKPAITIIDRTNVTIKNLVTSGYERGILIDNSRQIKLYNNTIGSFMQSNIIIKNSEDIDISRNRIPVFETDAYPDGIRIINSKICLVSDNRIIGDPECGILLTNSNNTSIHGNSIDGSRDGGIKLEYSEKNRIFWNTLKGIISIDASSGNDVYQNNFLAVRVISRGSSVNRWDNGYPSGGNYWSSYNGSDLHLSGYGNASQSDGIGDTPYVINADNKDNYPLMGIYNNFLTDKASGYQRVVIIGNTTISNFKFGVYDPSVGTLSFETGDTAGFCRVCIPKTLLNGSYSVTLDGQLLTPNELPFSGNSYEYLYIAYPQGNHVIQIKGLTTLVLSPLPTPTPEPTPLPPSPSPNQTANPTNAPTTSPTLTPTQPPNSTQTPTAPELSSIALLLAVILITSIALFGRKKLLAIAS